MFDSFNENYYFIFLLPKYNDPMRVDIIKSIAE